MKYEELNFILSQAYSHIDNQTKLIVIKTMKK